MLIHQIQFVAYYGNGPLFITKDYPPYYSDCSTYWYAYILLLNNFIPNGKGTSCMGYLWYIPNDYQFYALSPIFLILLYRFDYYYYLNINSSKFNSQTIKKLNLIFEDRKTLIRWEKGMALQNLNLIQQLLNRYLIQ